MEVVIQFKEATENSLDVLNDPQSSWKYLENMYYEYTVTPSLLKSILVYTTWFMDISQDHINVYVMEKAFKKLLIIVSVK